MVCTACGKQKAKSATRPNEDKDPSCEGLTVVVADSFQELVIDSDRHVFLDCYADWCGPCKEAKPHFHKLAELLRACDDIAICSMDTDANETPKAYIPESHIPVFKLFLRGDKQSPIAYSGERKLEGFLAFLRRHANIRIEDAMSLLYMSYCEYKDVELEFRKLLAALFHSSGRTPPSNLVRWAQQYFMDPDRFSKKSDGEANASEVEANEAVPVSLLPDCMQPIPEGARAQVTSDETLLERTHKLLGGGRFQAARKELLGKVGTIVSSSGTSVQVRFDTQDLSLDHRSTYEEQQGIVQLHREAIQVTQDVKTPVAGEKRKSLEVEQWALLAAEDHERLRGLVEKLSSVLMHTQPNDLKQYLIWGIIDQTPITDANVYPTYVGDTKPKRVPVKANQQMGKMEANSKWREVERAAFLPVPPGRVASDPLDPVRKLLSRGLCPDFAFCGRTLLHRACECGQLQLAELMFANGADLHVRGEDGSLPLEAATSKS